MKLLGVAILVCVLTSTAQFSQASILAFQRFRIDLTDHADTAKKATWSSDQLTISDAGLGWDGEEISSRRGWIKTAPFAVGESWRAPYSVSVDVVLSPPPSEITRSDGSPWTPGRGEAYVRYSPDLKHWSSWQALQHTEPATSRQKNEPGRYFSGTVSVPECERKAYYDLLHEYAKQDVPWTSDEEAAARWIVERQPDFFAQHQPFVDYVQFRFEGNFYTGQRLTSLKVETSYCMGGVCTVPRDPDVYKNHGSRLWSFRADDSPELPPIAPPYRPSGPGWVAPGKD